MTLQIVNVDYTNPRHGEDLVRLLNAYACDPMGGGAPLAADVQDRLVAGLAALPYAFSLLGYVDQQAVGVVNCFESFSTFKCRPLVNIHDIFVVPECRGRGYSLQLLAGVEAIAYAKGCCKLTLEVLEGNRPAQQAYRRFGFSGYELDPQMGKALFWEKMLEQA